MYFCPSIFEHFRMVWFRLGKLAEYAHHAEREKAAMVFFMSPILGQSERWRHKHEPPCPGGDCGKGWVKDLRYFCLSFSPISKLFCAYFVELKSKNLKPKFYFLSSYLITALTRSDCRHHYHICIISAIKITQTVHLFTFFIKRQGHFGPWRICSARKSHDISFS